MTTPLDFVVAELGAAPPLPAAPPQPAVQPQPPPLPPYDPRIEAAAAASLLREPPPLPSMEPGSSFMARSIPEPPQVVFGVLHQGCKLVLGGASKSYKTWTLLSLALAVASGKPWLGFKTHPGPSLFVNLELPEWAIQSRLKRLAQGMGITINDNLLVWNLRGHAAPYNIIVPRLVNQIQGRSFLSCTLDPVYKLLGNADENSATDVGDLLNHLEQINQAGPSLSCGAHFSKGNQAEKSAIDRISGSGVFARDPDTIVTFTAHEEDKCFTVDVILRNCPPVDPFVVRWDEQSGLMLRDTQQDPAALKQASGGRPPSFNQADLLSLLNGEPLPAKEWQRKALEDLGISRTHFYRLIHDLKTSNAITQTSPGLWSRSHLVP